MTIASELVPVSAHVREITDAEVAHYHEHGWVKLEGLLTAELTAEMLRVARERHHRPGPRDTDWTSLASSGVEPFRSLLLSPVMARNAVRLMDRRRLAGADIAVRFRADLYAEKPPGGAGICYHQDSCEHGSDRVGELQFWLALAEATPEMGTMRFLSGVHREGPLGSVFNAQDQDLLAVYPRLAEHYPPTAPISYRPGDATVHHGFMVHGSDANRTDRERLSYIFSYTPADARWWNGRVANSGSLRERLGDDLNPAIAVDAAS